MFKQNVTNKQYEQFIKENNLGHFLNTSKWAEFRAKTNWTYEIVGFEKEDELVIAAVIMFKKAGRLPYYLAYSTRGYAVKDKECEQQFTIELKKYLKSKKVFAYKIDPPTIYATLDKELNRVGAVNDNRVEELKSLGYIHKGFTNNFEGMQPRHTVRIDSNCTYEEALKRMDASTRRKTKTGSKYGLVIEHADKSKLPIFMEIFKDTAERDNFTIRDISYFKKMYEVLGDKVELTLAKIDFNIAITIMEDENDSITKQLKKVNTDLNSNKFEDKKLTKLQNRKKDLMSKLEKNESAIIEFKDQLNEYPNGKYIGGIICIVENDSIWYVYGASSSSFRYMLPSYALIANTLKESTERNYQFFDLFGISGDYDEESHLFGLYFFKKGFGGQAVEFIGEFDLIINKPVYFMFDHIYPRIKQLRKRH